MKHRTRGLAAALLPLATLTACGIVPALDPVTNPPAPAPVQYANCDAVRAAGAAPIYPGQPGWDPKFDGDHDGVGCEQPGTTPTTTVPAPPTTVPVPPTTVPVFDIDAAGLCYEGVRPEAIFWNMGNQDVQVNIWSTDLDDSGASLNGESRILMAPTTENHPYQAWPKGADGDWSDVVAWRVDGTNGRGLIDSGQFVQSEVCAPR